ncbi:MAG: photosystem II reaction center PsbP [Prochlorothrix sp.]|nr:photosystem II reaction center PsbP [Prochlorothrix sp.]
MLKSLFSLVVLLTGLFLTACNVTPTAGLQPYIDIPDGYRFLYPTGWVQVEVSGGPDVVFRDLINATENVSVIIQPVSADKQLSDLGTPGEVGYALQTTAIAPPDTGRSAELVDAYDFNNDGQTYYALEYAVTLPDQQRHDLVAVGVKRGKLYTLDVSTTEARWDRVSESFHKVVESFTTR